MFVELAGGSGGSVYVRLTAVSRVEASPSGRQGGATLVLVDGSRFSLAHTAEEALKPMATAEQSPTPPMLRLATPDPPQVQVLDA